MHPTTKSVLLAGLLALALLIVVLQLSMYVSQALTEDAVETLDVDSDAALLLPIDREGLRRDPIDVVVTWVDHSDKAWAHAFAQAMVDEGKYGPEDIKRRAPTTRSRLDRYDEELYYCLLGVVQNAPWVRRVHIVAQEPQVPQYLAEIQAAAADATGGAMEVRVVHHKDFMPQRARPTFSSICIETNLHRIPGLAERFLYLNDDCFIANPIHPSWLFDDAPVEVLAGSSSSSSSGSNGTVTSSKTSAGRAYAPRPPTCTGAKPVYPDRPMGWPQILSTVKMCEIGLCAVFWKQVVNTARMCAKMPRGSAFSAFSGTAHQGLPMTKKLLARAAALTAEVGASARSAEVDRWKHACEHKVRGVDDISVGMTAVNADLSLVVRDTVQRFHTNFVDPHTSSTRLPTRVHMFCVNTTYDSARLYEQLEGHFRQPSKVRGARVGDPEACGRLMVVAHPDDETIWGSRLLMDDGSDGSNGDDGSASTPWHVVCMTNHDSRERRAEFFNAMEWLGPRRVGCAEILNVRDVLFSVFGTNHFDVQEADAARERLRALVADPRYETVITHGPRGEYGHPQHKQCSRLVRDMRDALGEAAEGRTWLVFDPRRPTADDYAATGYTRSQPWMSQVPRKRELLAFYRSQAVSRHSDWIEGTAPMP